MKELAHHYHRRATTFFDAMHLLADDLTTYDNAAALLAVHAAISLADAIFVSRSGQTHQAEDHAQSIPELRRLCGRLRIDARGINHLEWLASRKSDIAYGGHRLDLETVVKMSITKAERFAVWIYSNFSEFKRED